MIFGKQQFNKFVEEFKGSLDEKSGYVIIPVDVDYDDWRGRVAAAFPYDEDGGIVSVGECASWATVLEVDDALEGADVPEPGETYDPGDGIELRNVLWGVRPRWWCVSAWFCHESVRFDSIEDFVEATEEAFGFRPVLDEFDDVARIRYYDTPEGRVVEGEEEFDREEWIARGANWEKVLVRI